MTPVLKKTSGCMPSWRKPYMPIFHAQAVNVHVHTRPQILNLHTTFRRGFYAYTAIHTPTNSHTYTHGDIHTHTHTPTCTHARKNTHTYTHTHTHTQFEKPPLQDAVADVVVVPIFEDNYSYILIDRTTRQSACIDPADAEAVWSAVQNSGTDLRHVLCTHKHWDHAGGNVSMRAKKPDICVYGGSTDESEGLTHRLGDGQSIQLGNLEIQCFHMPCHTRGHVVYLVRDMVNKNMSPILFTGDSLFVGGCGRFFEGDGVAMLKNLHTFACIASDDTHVYCGHEYTVNNLKFAESLEPENENVRQKLVWAQRQIATSEYTVPSTYGQEKLYNPFVRYKMFQKRYPGWTDAQIIQEIRSLKDKA